MLFHVLHNQGPGHLTSVPQAGDTLDCRDHQVTTPYHSNILMDGAASHPPVTKTCQNSTTSRPTGKPTTKSSTSHGGKREDSSRSLTPPADRRLVGKSAQSVWPGWSWVTSGNLRLRGNTERNAGMPMKGASGENTFRTPWTGTAENKQH